MACDTLKRHHNFDFLDSNESKRRRFQTCSQSFNINLPASQSPFIPKHESTQGDLKKRIKEEIKRLQRRRLIPRFFGSPTPTVPSTFTSHVQELSVLDSCSGSFQSLVLRSPTSPESDGDHSSRNECNPINTDGINKSSSHCSRSIDSVPIFTLSQVTTLCERLVKEREQELRLEYDGILSCKLTEQYEAFLKFNHDQLYSRFQNAPMSYVS